MRGPETKTCAGKKNGIWTHKNKNAKCVGKLAKAFPSWNMTEMKFTSQIGKLMLKDKHNVGLFFQISLRHTLHALKTYQCLSRNPMIIL